MPHKVGLEVLTSPKKTLNSHAPKQPVIGLLYLPAPESEHDTAKGTGVTAQRTTNKRSDSVACQSVEMPRLLPLYSWCNSCDEMKSQEIWRENSAQWVHWSMTFNSNTSILLASWIRHLSTISEDLPLHSLPFLEAPYWLSIKSVPAWFYTLMPQDGSDLAHAFAHLSIWEEVVNILESIWDWDPHFQRSLPAASWTSRCSLVRYDDDSGKSKCSDYLLYQFMFLHCGFPSCLMGQALAHTIFLWSFNLQLNRMQIYPGPQLDLQALGKTVEMEVLWSPPTLSCRAQGYGLAPASVNLVGLKSLLGGNQHLRLGWSTLRIRRGILNADFIKRCVHSNNHFLIPFEPFLPTTGNFSLTLPGSPSLYRSYSLVGEGRKWHRTKPIFFFCGQLQPGQGLFTLPSLLLSWVAGGLWFKTGK